MPFAPACRVRATAGPLRPTPLISVPAVVIGRMPAAPSADLAPAPEEQDLATQEQPGPRGGKLLCDEAGRLFEWTGDRLHAVHPSELGRRPQAPAAPPFRALCPEPGLRLVVRWPQLRRLLEPHIAYPERLRGTHRLAVRVQVYEATRPQRVADLARAALGAPERAGELAPLTSSLAAHLGLQGRIPPPSQRTAPAAGPGRDGLASGERVVHLVPLVDPTALAAARPRSPRPCPQRPSRAEGDGADRANGFFDRLRDLFRRREAGA
jgi:hypothetical protein